MARIPLPGADLIEALTASGGSTDVLSHYSQRPNVIRAVMRSPEIADDLSRLTSSLFAATGLSDVDRELVILACGTCYRSLYETAHHVPISVAVGVTADERRAITDRDWGAACFSAAHQALLRFVAAASEAPTVPDAVLDAAQEHYDDRQIVDTVVIIGFYFLIARLSTVLSVPIDARSDDSILQHVRAVYAER